MNSPSTKHNARRHHLNERVRKAAAFRRLDEFIKSAASKSLPVVTLRPTNLLEFDLQGSRTGVMRKDILAYGRFLVEFKLATQFERIKQAFAFHLTPDAVTLLKTGRFSSANIRVGKHPEGTAASPRVSRGTAEAELAKAELIQRQHGLPLASAMCIPVLKQSRTPVRFANLIKAVTNEMRFNHRLVDLPIPVGTNQTFKLRMMVAVEYLIAQGLLCREGGLYTCTSAGEAKAAVRGQAEPWLGFKEQTVREMVRPSISLPNEARGPFHVLKTDVSKIIATFGEAGPTKLVAIFDNAHKMLAEADINDNHSKAQAILGALKEEFELRLAPDHPDRWFKWPTTEAGSGSGVSLGVPMQPDGMLAHLGYHVGRTRGEDITLRQSTLRRIFEKPLPTALGKAYAEEWGPDGSAGRLRKMAESIATFTKNAKYKNDESYAQAIFQWEQDLEYLHDRYYVGKFHFDFPWPSTSTPKRQ
ncbi:hypothetical protein [Rhizobium sp. IBUN]|uniref:hypothetical protein n=1 Tax=Rhizobium sp. IBUN TaxID=1042326 RepID=UPI0003FDDCD6|nr:hypothetical protein [Rhizobium sp. IBUN]